MIREHLKIFHPMRLWPLYFAISLAVILPGVYSLYRNGLKLGIDFTGGTTFSWQGDSLSEDLIKSKAESLSLSIKEVRSEGNIWTVTTDSLDKDTYQKLMPEGVTELSFDTVGPALGAELLKKTLYGIGLAATLILLYVAYRFRDLKFGASAILAMIHDLLVVLGVFSILGYYLGVEIDTLFVTALLTILSFSVHDTIVVYDRIRELKKKHGYLDFDDIVNRAVVETMGRSINNSMTIIFMLMAMYMMGGDTTHWFIFALLIGTISGTYSSTFTAAPILIVWDKLSKRKLKK